MDTKNRDENAKGFNWKVPGNLPGVTLRDNHTDSENGGNSPVPAGSAVRGIDQSGVTGFSPQLAGHAKADHAGTSSFSAGSADYITPSDISGAELTGQEKNGRKRQTTTSAVARITHE